MTFTLYCCYTDSTISSWDIRCCSVFRPDLELDI